MPYLHELLKMAALAAMPGLAFSYLLGPVACALISCAVLYALIVRSS